MKAGALLMMVCTAATSHNYFTVVKAVRGMNVQICTKASNLVHRYIFDLLDSNLPGAKADFQWGRHIGRFTMAAIRKHIFTFLANK